MELHELVIEMKLLERRMTLYEEKYGLLSFDIYTAFTAGELNGYDAFVETRSDFSRWKDFYETWARLKATYDLQVRQRPISDYLRMQPSY